MITVLTGTQKVLFTRMVQGILDYAQCAPLRPICFQAGHNVINSPPANVTVFDFAPQCQIDRLIAGSELVVTHGGTGSIINALERDKKVIVIPRLEKFAEHNDDHQLQIANYFSESGYVLLWQEGQSLTEVIKQVPSFEPLPYVSTYEQILASVISDLKTFLV